MMLIFPQTSTITSPKPVWKVLTLCGALQKESTLRLRDQGESEKPSGGTLRGEKAKGMAPVSSFTWPCTFRSLNNTLTTLPLQLSVQRQRLP